MNFKIQNDEQLINNLQSLVSDERKQLATLLDCLKEVDNRRLYIKLGYNSLFTYLTEKLKYSPASAQRRIDAARLLSDIPEIKNEIATGNLQLTQIGIVSQGIKEKQKTAGLKITVYQKKELLELVKNKTIQESQIQVAQSLNLEIKAYEKSCMQKDESVRLEITLSSKQYQRLQRVKELVSNSKGILSTVELIDYLLAEYIKRRDPLAKIEQTDKPSNKSNFSISNASRTSAAEARNHSMSIASITKSPLRKTITTKTRREVFRRDVCCQHKDPQNQKICGTKLNLQIDHVVPVWAGGTNNTENLQLLCAAHNRMKYHNQAGIRTVS